MPNDASSNHLDTPDDAKREWVSLGVAVEPDFKSRLEKVARNAGLNSSAFARMVLMREVSQLEREAAA